MDFSTTPEERAFRESLRSWLRDNLPLGWGTPRFPMPQEAGEKVAFARQWAKKLHAGGWAGLGWPRAHGGRELSPLEHLMFQEEYTAAGAPSMMDFGVGPALVGPTLIAHGTDWQKERFLEKILNGDEVWCQGFSEPGAGSDLASLSTRGELDGDDLVVNGQKVWTSYAQYSRWGICLARTDTELPKHKGISYLVVDMEADGVEIRPLRQITGDHEFNEVFFTDAFVPENHLIGGLNNGWAVANTTLAHERGTTFPFKEQVVHEVFLDDLYRQASAAGTLDDPAVAEALVDSFVELRVLRLHNWRTLSRLAKGIEPGPESSWIKLAWTDMTQHMATTALDLCGPAAPLWRGAADLPGDGKWQRQWLWSKAGSIAGGTSEVQKNIVSERILGLPRG